MRSPGWLLRECITLTVLMLFVVLMAHIAGGAGMILEAPQ